MPEIACVPGEVERRATQVLGSGKYVPEEFADGDDFHGEKGIEGKGFKQAYRLLSGIGFARSAALFLLERQEINSRENSLMRHGAARIVGILRLLLGSRCSLGVAQEDRG